MKKTVTAIGAVIALAVLGTGCDRTYGDDGDPGKVSDRSRVYKTRAHHWDYDLTVRRADGTKYGIDVSEDVYDHCYRGSSYPACAKN